MLGSWDHTNCTSRIRTPMMIRPVTYIDDHIVEATSFPIKNVILCMGHAYTDSKVPLNDSRRMANDISHSMLKLTDVTMVPTRMNVGICAIPVSSKRCWEFVPPRIAFPNNRNGTTHTRGPKNRDTMRSG